MQIRISDKTRGECVITINKKIGKREEYSIKALCMLQLMCMSGDINDDRFKEFTKILEEATIKIEKIYNSEGEKDADPFEHFNSVNI